MNGSEFFMMYAGYQLLPSERATGDCVADAEALFQMSLPLNTGKKLRLSSSWWVVTPEWVATSFKVLAGTGFKTDVSKSEAIVSALKADLPCLVLLLGKRTLAPKDLFVTYDPRAVRICSEGKHATVDYTQGGKIGHSD
jgi:NAD(P)H-hydrate repair Nnr-like enzyme with NAD(P)H-hydrate dehydratase domain